jgi:quercetin dioxygenase-like cupin family protein
MAEIAQSICVPPGKGPTIQGPLGGPLTFKARGEQTGGRLTALENVIPPGEGPPLHTHTAEDESWYVLEGELRFLVGAELFNAPAGTFLFAPRGMPHTFQNVGDQPARLLILFNPSGIEQFFDQFAEVADGQSVPSAFQQIGASVGMEVVGPPLAQSHP